VAVRASVDNTLLVFFPESLHTLPHDAHARRITARRMDIGGVTVFGGSLPPSALSGVGRPAPSGVEVIETDHIDGATIAEMKAVLKSKGVKSTYSTRDEYLKAIKVIPAYASQTAFHLL
jgi:hypothetical protein